MNADPSPSPASTPPSFIGSDGLWQQVLRPLAGSTLRPALFLDRDGVIVEEVGHLRRADDVRLIPGAAAVIAAANRAGVPVVVVSNQSGVGRGLFGWDDFAAVQERMLALLADDGAWLDAVFACPFHAAALPPWRHPDHPARKPNPGMLLSAAARLPIDIQQSWIVGDRAGDIAAGRAAGLAGGLHVATGWGSEPGEPAAAEAFATSGYRVLTAMSLAAARGLLPLF